MLFHLKKRKKNVAFLNGLPDSWSLAKFLVCSNYPEVICSKGILKSEYIFEHDYN